MSMLAISGSSVGLKLVYATAQASPYTYKVHKNMDRDHQVKTEKIENK